MNSTKCKAIILRATKYSEADLILQILTNTGEKLSVIAKAALKSKKRFGGGVLQPSHFVELGLKKSAHVEKMPVVEEAVLINGFEKIRSDYDRMEICFFILECLSKASQEGDVHASGLFDLGGNALKALEFASNLELLKLHFGLKLLFQQGVLEPESWMREFLATSLPEHNKLGAGDPAPLRQRNIWLENRVREYLSTGMLN